MKTAREIAEEIAVKVHNTTPATIARLKDDVEEALESYAKQRAEAVKAEAVRLCMDFPEYTQIHEVIKGRIEKIDVEGL